MNIHAIQTGWVRIKTAQIEGRGRGLRRRLGPYVDRNWSDWLANSLCRCLKAALSTAMQHSDGVIAVTEGRPRMDLPGW